MKNALAGCVVGASAAPLGDRSRLAGCALGGGGAAVASKLLKKKVAMESPKIESYDRHFEG